MPNKFFVLLFVVAVFIVGILLYIYNPDGVEYKNPNEPEQVVCTMDAKMCPDGSYVGRSGPKCEFAACPIPKDAIFEDGTIPAEQ
jgi:hypothetical protein